MLTTTEFAQKIKAKYPQYANIDDNELALKIVQKHPEYKNQVQIESKVPPSSAALYMQRQAGVPEDQAYQEASIEKSIAQPQGTMVSRFKEGFAEEQQRGRERFQEGYQENIEGANTGEFSKSFVGGTKMASSLAQQTAGSVLMGGIKAVLPPIANSIKNAYTTPAIEGGVSAQDVVGKVSEYTPDVIKESFKGEAQNMANVLSETWDLLPEKAQYVTSNFLWSSLLASDVIPLVELPKFISGIARKSPALARSLEKLLQESAEKAPQKFDEIYGATTKALGEAGESIRGAKAKIGEVAGTAKEYGISQATGLSPETFGTIRKTPDLFEQAQKGLITRETLADDVAKAMDEIISTKSSTGKGYQAVRESIDTFTVPKSDLESLVAKKGLTVEKGVIKPSGRLTTNLTDTDIAQANKAWKLIGDQTTFTGDQYLNLRNQLDELAKWDKGLSTKGQQVIRDIRGTVDRYAKKELKGLAELDAQFSDVAKQFKKLKNDFFKYEDGNVVLKDNAMSKIANLTNKGREKVLARLEEVAPDIADKIRVVKAIEDIENAMGQKVGAYTRSVLGGGGAVMTYLNPAVGVPMLLGSMLTNPKVAAGIMKKYSQRFRLSPKRIEGMIDTVTNMGKLSKADSKVIVETAKLLPAGKGETLAGEAFANRLRYGAKNQAKQLPVGRPADAAFDQTIKKGGVTIRSTGGAPEKGFVVSPYKEYEAIVDAQDFSTAKIKEYMADHADTLSEEGHHLGLWYNADDGKIYIDTVVVKDSADDAFKLAKDNNQIAFYDLEKGTEITTKGYSPSKSKSLGGGTTGSGGSAKSTGGVTSDSQLRKSVNNIVKDYKENPSVGDFSKVKKIKEKLTNTPEGKYSAKISQEALAPLADEDGMITVYRGGGMDFGKSDAGWSTNSDDALRFALQNEGEIAVAKAPLKDVMYYDSALKTTKSFDEGEIIFKNLDSAKSFDYVDVSKYADEYADLGYAPKKVEDLVEQKFGKYKIKKTTKSTGTVDDTFNAIKKEIKLTNEKDIRKYIGKRQMSDDVVAKAKADLDELYTKAPDAKREIDTLAQDIADDLGTKYGISKAPLKKYDRAFEKVIMEYDGDVSRLGDVPRNIIIVESADDLPKIKKVLKDRGAIKVKHTTQYKDPLGYSGVNTKFEANGIVGEIQANTPDMIYAKEKASIAKQILGNKLWKEMDVKYKGTGGKGHTMYEEWRKLINKESARAKAIADESMIYYDLFR